MVSFEEEFHCENGYDPLTQEERKAICNVFNIAEDKLFFSDELGIDILHAVELTGVIYQKSCSASEAGRELFPYDFSPVVVIWYKVFEKLMREIYVPVIKQLIPEHQIALQPRGEEIPVWRIDHNQFTLGNISWLVGVILKRNDVCTAGCSSLKMPCSHRLKTTPFRNIQKVYHEAMRKDITYGEANDFVEQVGKEIKYWLETL